MKYVDPDDSASGGLIGNSCDSSPHCPMARPETTETRLAAGASLAEDQIETEYEELTEEVFDSLALRISTRSELTDVVDSAGAVNDWASQVVAVADRHGPSAPEGNETKLNELAAACWLLSPIPSPRAEKQLISQTPRTLRLVTRKEYLAWFCPTE